MKNNFSPPQAFFCPLFTLLAAREGQVVLAVTPGTWYPAPERLCWHQQGPGRAAGQLPCHKDVLSLLPLSLQHPTQTKPTKLLCPQGQDSQKHLHLATWCRYAAPALPSPATISGVVLPLKIISPSKGEGGGRGQALVQGTKCLDPAKFKGTLPPAPRRDEAGRRMAGGHTDRKVCNNPFITLQILVLLTFAAAIFLLGNW